jgi:hypothetical protein
VLVFDWRRRLWMRLDPDGELAMTLDFQDWALHVLCPLLPGDLAVFGDVSKYATAGDRRFGGISCDGAVVSFDVLGAPGEAVDVWGYAASGLTRVRTWEPGDERELENDRWSWDAVSGGWVVRVRIPPRGWLRLIVA